MQHVHIVGISPRTGTTLMMELMAHCFDFDAYADHESSVFVAPDVPVDRYCSKLPSEIAAARRALRINPELWALCMVRDPRDVIVSRHGKQPDAYWSNLQVIKKRAAILRQAREHERFLVVHYEDLVTDPDSLQTQLLGQIPFLQKQRNFSDFEKTAKPTANAEVALGGLRPISTSSIGNWKHELPRVKAQIELYGSMNDLLVELGYETNASWEKMLKGIVPDNGTEKRNRKKPLNFGKGLERRLKAKLRELRYKAGFPMKRPAVSTRVNSQEKGDQ